MIILRTLLPNETVPISTKVIKTRRKMSVDAGRCRSQDDEEEGSSVTGDDAPPGGDIGQERSAAPLTKRSVSGGSVETATSLSRDSSSRITRQGTPQDGGSNAHGTPGIFYRSDVG